jgi:hypothetical protein
MTADAPCHARRHAWCAAVPLSGDTMTPYDRKPWLSSYEPGKPHAITPEFTDA